MTPSIPIPTDNVYKFTALFGLVVFISAMLASVYVNSKYNELGYSSYQELELLKAKEDLSQTEIIKKAILELRLDIDSSDRNAFMTMLFICMIVGAFLSIGGGICWFRIVQPKQDELFNLQIEKTRREIEVLNRQLEKSE